MNHSILPKLSEQDQAGVANLLTRRQKTHEELLRTTDELFKTLNGKLTEQQKSLETTGKAREGLQEVLSRVEAMNESFWGRLSSVWGVETKGKKEAAKTLAVSLNEGDEAGIQQALMRQ